MITRPFWDRRKAVWRNWSHSDRGARAGYGLQLRGCRSAVATEPGEHPAADSQDSRMVPCLHLTAWRRCQLRRFWQYQGERSPKILDRILVLFLRVTDSLFINGAVPARDNDKVIIAALNERLDCCPSLVIACREVLHSARKAIKIQHGVYRVLSFVD